MVTSEVVGDRKANSRSIYTLPLRLLLDFLLLHIADIDMTRFQLLFGSTAFSAPTRPIMSYRCDLIEERFD